jgi:hypothetical protein
MKSTGYYVSCETVSSSATFCKGTTQGKCRSYHLVLFRIPIAGIGSEL